MSTMVMRQMTASPSEALPYGLHQLDMGDELQHVDFGKWHDGDSQVDMLYSPSSLSHHASDSIYGHTYAVGHPHHVDLRSQHPSFMEPPSNFAPPDVATFDESSPYTQYDGNGRSTPHSQTSNSGTRAGSGRSTTKSSSPGLPPLTNGARVSKSKPRKAKPSKSSVGKYKSLLAPLSQWRLENGVAIKDVEAIVDRPLEQRREDSLTKKDRKPCRPMNRFMLYRSAYIPVAQKYCEEHGKNHQVVSKICGESWNSETKEVREWFSELALRERDRHTEAFPGYKFTPKNKDRTEDDDDEDLLNDDEWRPRSRYPAHGGRRVKAESPYAPNVYGSAFNQPLHDGQFDFDPGMSVPGGFDMGAAMHAPFGGPQLIPQGDMFGSYFPQYHGMGPIGMHQMGEQPATHMAGLPRQDIPGPIIGEPHMSFFTGGHFVGGDADMMSHAHQGSGGQLDPSLLQGAVDGQDPDYKPSPEADGGGHGYVESTPLLEADEPRSEWSLMHGQHG